MDGRVHIVFAVHTHFAKRIVASELRFAQLPNDKERLLSEEIICQIKFGKC